MGHSKCGASMPHHSSEELLGLGRPACCTFSGTAVSPESQDVARHLIPRWDPSEAPASRMQRMAFSSIISSLERDHRKARGHLRRPRLWFTREGHGGSWGQTSATTCAMVKTPFKYRVGRNGHEPLNRVLDKMFEPAKVCRRFREPSEKRKNHNSNKDTPCLQPSWDQRPSWIYERLLPFDTVCGFKWQFLSGGPFLSLTGCQKDNPRCWYSVIVNIAMCKTKTV